MDDSVIVRYGKNILREKASDIEEFNDEVKALIERMYEVLTLTHGLGVAGPQMGVSKRIFVYDVGEGKHALINPKFISKRGEECGAEGCLSIPGLQGDVLRATKVVMKGIDEEGNEVKIRADGLLARVFQHEMDHLDGMLFIDRADPETLETVPLHGEEQEDQDNY
ncbi:MAG: peptide deformylase [Armatimonadetes bacterium]|nr:peptide deformylase [Armatimonadota bacterium]